MNWNIFFITAFFIAAICALLFMSTRILETGLVHKLEKIINECEKELPRNQRCKLIAVKDK